VLLEKLVVAQVVRELTNFMEPKDSLFIPKATTVSYPGPDRSTPHPTMVIAFTICDLKSPVCLQ
jgi:hypothetical protein